MQLDRIAETLACWTVQITRPLALIPARRVGDVPRPRKDFSLRGRHGSSCPTREPLDDRKLFPKLESRARLKLQKSTVSRLVRQLQKRNWVVREVSSKDNRVILVRLTRKGLAAGKRLAFARQNKFASVLAAIPRAERNLVSNALTILTRALEKKQP